METPAPFPTPQRPIHALAHPIALVAIVVWLLNDHLLKSMAPGIITGKLSDIAGMIVTPLTVAVLLDSITPRVVRARRGFARANAWLSVVVVALAFAAAKTTTSGHDTYVIVATFLRSPLHGLVGRFHSGAFGETVVLVRDVTDLIAIPFGLVSVGLLEEQLRRSSRDQQDKER